MFCLFLVKLFFKKGLFCFDLEIHILKLYVTLVKYLKRRQPRITLGLTVSSDLTHLHTYNYLQYLEKAPTVTFNSVNEDHCNP